MRIKADAARPQVIRLGIALQTDVAKQSGQQRAVDLLMCGRLFADVPIQLGHQLGKLRMHVAPLAHAPHRKKIFLAGGGQLAIGQFVTRFLEKSPQLEEAAEIRLLVLEACVRLIGRRLPFQRSVARVLHRQGRRDHQHLGQRLAVTPAEDHAADARVERQA